MTGGTVLGIDHAADELLVRVQGNMFSGTCVIPLLCSDHQIKAGDRLNWQGRFAWWANGVHSPVRLQRTGFAMSEQQASDRIAASQMAETLLH